MGKLNNGILGGFSGKVGPVVGVYNKNTYYMRSLPAKRTTFTEAELLNQAKFKLVQDYLRPIKELLIVGFKNYFTKTGGYRAAIAYTRKHALANDEHGFHINPALFKISGGDLAPAVNPRVSLENQSTLLFQWEQAAADSNAHSADQLLVLLYHQESFLAYYQIYATAFRHQGTYSLEVPPELKEKDIDIYMGFVAANGLKQSDSQYLGRIAL